ncbi:MAG: response regulator [Akkermansiaceae bacterium]|nr:response regulator [Akkermansiaceae bacterium]
MANQKLVDFLLVEDDDDHADLVIRALKKGRVVNRIDRARDGVEAMRFLRKEGEFAGVPRPDIVILDLKLPRKDGLEVLQEVRDDPHLSMLPIVILTTSSAETDRARAYEYHANSYLKKPIDFEQFRKMVEDLSLYWGVWNEAPPES